MKKETWLGVTRFDTRQVIVIGLMIATEIILTRFLSITTPVLRIGLGFMAIAVVGMLYGPLSAALTGALADILGVSLFSPFAPFPGFTLTAFLTGAVYGIFLHNRKGHIIPIVAAVLIVTVVLQLGLDTLWVQIITGTNYFALLPPRVIRTAIMIPVQIFLIKTMAQLLLTLQRRGFFQ